MNLLVGIDLSTDGKAGTTWEEDRALNVAMCVEDVSGRVEFEKLWTIPQIVRLSPELQERLGVTIAPGSEMRVRHQIRTVFEDVMHHIEKYVERGGVIVGHNIYYDLGVLGLELQRFGLPITWIQATLSTDRIIDTLALCEAPGSKTLEASCKWYGVEPIGRFHDSAVDARATVDLARKIVLLK